MGKRWLKWDLLLDTGRLALRQTVHVAFWLDINYKPDLKLTFFRVKSNQAYIKI